MCGWVQSVSGEVPEQGNNDTHLIYVNIACILVTSRYFREKGDFIDKR